MAREFTKERSRTDRIELPEAKNFDYTTFWSVVLLTAAGLVAIYSATYAANMNNRFGQQLWFGAIGFGIMMVMSFIPSRWFSVAAYPFYVICLGLLVYVAMFGELVYGQRSWIALTSTLRFQPTEVAKLGTIMAVAKFLSGDRDMTRPHNVLISIILVALPIGLIMMEPDPGSALLFGALLLILLLWGGVDLFLLFVVTSPILVVVASLFGKASMLVAVFTVGAIVFFFFRKNMLNTILAYLIIMVAAFSTNAVYDQLREHQKNRVQVLLNPELDPLGAGYNVIQTRMAIGSGGLTGKGFLKGTQTQLRYVPKQWTDFIISVPAEEFGFAGTLFLILLYAFVIFRGVAVASSVRSKFASVVAIGIAGIWFIQVFVNIGMSLGMLPVIGIPLPFMSYGGSALLTNLLMAGILMNLYRSRRQLY